MGSNWSGRVELGGLTRTVLETALEVEMSEHLGYDKHDAVGRNLGNSRNGSRSKTVLTQGRARDDRGATRPGRHAAGRRQSRSIPGGCQEWTSWSSRASAKGLTTGEISGVRRPGCLALVAP